MKSRSAISIADPDPCFFGDRETGAGPQNASAATVFLQTVLFPTAPVDFDIVNETGDFAEIGAFASATGGAARAQLTDAIHQIALAGAGEIEETVDNNGYLLIDALGGFLTVRMHMVLRRSKAALAGVYRRRRRHPPRGHQRRLRDDRRDCGCHRNEPCSCRCQQRRRRDVQHGNRSKDTLGGGGFTAYNTIENNGWLNIGAYAFASAANGNGTADAAQRRGSYRMLAWRSALETRSTLWPMMERLLSQLRPMRLDQLVR